MPHRDPIPLAIVGAGVTGLAIAHGLIRRGIPGRMITVFEAQQDPGGMAGSFLLNGVRLDRFYHFLCGPDREYVRLLSELGLRERLRWRRSDMAFFDKGRLVRFSGGLDLLRYPGIDMLSKARYAALVFSVRLMRDWRHLEHIPAVAWLRRRLGTRGYEALWAELIRRKFGPYSDSLSAAWIWARIRRNARSRRFLLYDWLGYVQGGTGLFIDALVSSLTRQGVRIRCGAPVDRIIVSPGGRIDALQIGAERLPATRVMYAGQLIRLPDLLQGPVPEEYTGRLRRLESLGLVCAVLELERPLTGRFWTNITDAATPQTGVVEFTALAPEYHPEGKSVVYIPQYCELSRADHEALDEDKVVAGIIPHLSRLNPRFRPEWISGSAVFSELYAQPVCRVGFTASIPGYDSGVLGLWALDHTLLLPDDRTIAGCIGLADGLVASIDVPSLLKDEQAVRPA